MHVQQEESNMWTEVSYCIEQRLHLEVVLHSRTEHVHIHNIRYSSGVVFSLIVTSLVTFFKCIVPLGVCQPCKFNPFQPGATSLYLCCLQTQVSFSPPCLNSNGPKHHLVSLSWVLLLSLCDFNLGKWLWVLLTVLTVCCLCCLDMVRAAQLIIIIICPVLKTDMMYIHSISK